VTAGGCLGILIPPSILLIVYGATAGVSVVQLYAGALLPGLMLAGLYVGYVILLAKLKPELMPPLSEDERRVPLPEYARVISQRRRNALVGLLAGVFSGERVLPRHTALGQLVVALLPAAVVVGALVFTYRVATAPTAELVAVTYGAGGLVAAPEEQSAGLIGVPEAAEEPEQQAEGAEAVLPPPAEEPGEATAPQEVAAASEGAAEPAEATSQGDPVAVPGWFWITMALCAVLVALLYWIWTWQRFQVFKLLLTSFFPLALLILAVLGSIMFGFATPTEAAAVGAFGGFLLTVAYRFVEQLRGPHRAGAAWRTAREVAVITKDSSFLTAKTTAMVCWLFVGSSIFSASFALLGGQQIIERWVLSLELTPIQFMILAQLVIFILGWPLEWTEIIVIFMPIFIPLLAHFNIDPLFFGLLVALNLQTAFLSPPVAMAAFYLKGVAPPHVTLVQIFQGMLPFMGIQVIAMALLYIWPEIGLWLPSVLYAR
jgi:TRAP-type mannitol/chloroaromatic compound transport system permease large subunit